MKQFLQLEAASGVILFTMAILSMVWANSPLAFIQERFIHSSLFLINECLMTLFFLMVGLELKRGLLQEQIADRSRLWLPGLGALLGMIVPALIYCLINIRNPSLLRGWATPVATDIAFAVGVLALFGKRVPFTLKLFLLSLAIFDDLGAVIIIGIFYTKQLSYLALLQAGILIILLHLFNRIKNIAWPLYAIVGVMIWCAFLNAGVHPTITGFLLAVLLPSDDHESRARLQRLETMLHPWVAFLVIPLFALANAGLSFHDLDWAAVVNTLVLGIAAGLFIGKQLGVMSAVWLLVKTGRARLPEETTWQMIYGVSILCGIGFTMSLFLGTLSFQNDSTYLAQVRLGVILGSLLSGLVGAMVLITAFARNNIERSNNI